VSDSLVHRSSLSHRQLGWKSAFRLAAFGLIVSSDWSVPLSMRESSDPGKIRCKHTLTGNFVGCWTGCGPDM
jgi:hypothetical protein